MSGQAVVAFADPATAKRVRHELVEAVREGHVRLEDAVVVERALEGEVRLHQLRNAVAAGAAVSSSLGSRLADESVDDNLLIAALGARLRPGTAALIVLGSADARDEIIERVKPYGGEVLEAFLSRTELAQLREALANAAGAVLGPA